MRLWAIGAVVGAAALAAGYFALRPTGGSANDAPYRSAAIDRGRITASVRATGTLTPMTTVVVGSQLSGHDLASANAAFVLCYGVGMVLGPQVIGVGMDLFGTAGFGWALALFFAAYIALALGRIMLKVRRT